jgi:hypothetical protein
MGLVVLDRFRVIVGGIYSWSIPKLSPACHVFVT